ncbi:MAG: CocE/NonD family hydrolase [Cyanobacteria bacterium J06643_4]
MRSIQPRQTYSMRTRDGVRLDADVYFPEGEGPFPVLLMRQPYGRAIASTIVYAHPCWYAAHGYIVVIQDVRGRGTSEGVFDLFAYEVADGEDAVNWAAQLPGSDGQVGMYGFSYQGMTQLQAAQAKPPALKTIAPAMTGYHLYEDWASENGALYFQLGLMWAIQLAAETARIQGDVAQYQALLAAAHDLPLRDEVPLCPDALAGLDSFWHDWVGQSANADYWRKLTPQLKDVDLPMLHIGGWFDPYLRGDVRLYEEMAARSEYLHHFWIGPWGHIPWGHQVGDVDFGPVAMSPVDSLQIRWFDAVLKGKNLAELSAQLPVCLFEMGRNQWQQLETWPMGARQPYYLQSDGLANIRADSGVLSARPAAAKTYDLLVHDPWNPAPAKGGHWSAPSGAFDRTVVDLRGDILTYTSPPLTEELRVAGVVEVVCAIASSTPSYDLCAVLSRVTEGRVFNLTQGYCRLTAAVDASLEVTLPLHPTCFSLAVGECLRLSLSAACFPAFSINPGTGVLPKNARLIEAQITTLTVALGGKQGSSIRLPLMPD